MPANECIPFYDDGDEIPVEAAATLTGKRFVVITGRETGYAAGTGINLGLDTNASGGNYLANIGAAGAKAAGVTSYDAATGEKLTILRRKILPVTCGATVTVGSEVEIDSVGRVINLSAGKAVGLALTGNTVGNDAEILVY
jgi:hypothetical protein